MQLVDDCHACCDRGSTPGVGPRGLWPASRRGRSSARITVAAMAGCAPRSTPSGLESMRHRWTVAPVSRSPWSTLPDANRIAVVAPGGPIRDHQDLRRGGGVQYCGHSGDSPPSQSDPLDVALYSRRVTEKGRAPDGPRRVVLCTDSLVVGGAERSLVNLVGAYEGPTELAVCSPSPDLLAECRDAAPRVETRLLPVGLSFPAHGSCSPCGVRRAWGEPACR